MNWLKYLLEANLYLVTFYTLYFVIFRKETYYQLNRVYLLVSTVMAFIIPVVQVGILSTSYLQLEDVVVTTISAPEAADHAWPIVNYALLAYGLIALLLLANMCFKIWKLIALSHKNRKTVHAAYKLVELKDGNEAFSFFSYLFVSPALMGSSTIVDHELVHIRQKHSWDIIYLEVLKALNWFNPVIWLMQSSMREVHEFIADQHSVNAGTSAEKYTDLLVDNAYGIGQNTLTNTFFDKNLLKKRIMMLHRKRSGNAARLKYLLIIPLICGMLCASTLAFAKTYRWIDLAPRHTIRLSLNEPAKINIMHRLKVTMGANSFITDKITFKDNKGQNKTYTVNSLTDEDRDYLLRTKNVKIEVVEASSNLTDTLKNHAKVKRNVKHHTDSINRKVNSEIRKQIDTERSKYAKVPPPPPPTPPTKTKIVDQVKLPPAKVKSPQKIVLIPPPAVPEKTIAAKKIKRPPPPPPQAPDITIDEPGVKKLPPPPPAPPDSTRKNN